ncbi:MAG TPA: TetR family transcriptional regulator [Isosphaeraceae bacterium]|nr:TetR family transcriptional regulator [Isosphaeraceae bacterium]
MTRGKRTKGAGAAAPEQGRKGAATREAILQSARIAFTRSGYDGVGVREIAQGAGVTAMMVNRYFGSKEQLFAEVVDNMQSTKSILTGHAGTLGQEAAAALAATPARGLDGFLLLLRSSSNPQAVTIIHDAIERNFQAPLAAMLPGANAGERAAVLLSIIAGIQLMRQVFRLDALALESPEAQSVLARELEALFDQLIRRSDHR